MASWFNPGDANRFVGFYNFTPTADPDTGDISNDEEVDANWTLYATVPCKITEQRGKEKFASGREIARRVITLRCWYDSNISVLQRIVDDVGEKFDIISVAVLGHFEALEIIGEART